jgi:protein phosphatase
MKKAVAYGKTDVGRKRSNNQDSIIVNDRLMLYAIADGMGGHKGGEIASSLCLEVLESAVAKMADRNNDFQVAPFLKEGITLASMRIYERASMDENLRGMGTTLVSLYLKDDKAYISQVGDSRVYLYSGGGLWKITEDHSLINEQVRSGLISRDQAEKLSYKNVITRSVGFEEIVEVDIYIRDLQAGDIFLLCSDGLTSMISDNDIKANIDENDLAGSCKHLIDAANEAGGADNVSVILVRVS